jgi:hypothetical protein
MDGELRSALGTFILPASEPDAYAAREAFGAVFGVAFPAAFRVVSGAAATVKGLAVFAAWCVAHARPSESPLTVFDC